MAKEKRRTFLYIDNSNLYYELQRVSAVKKKLPGAKDIYEAMKTKTLDYSAGIDYQRLFEFLAGNKDSVTVAKVFGSFSGTSSTLPEVIERAGFETMVYERSPWSGREKRVDTAVTFYIARDAYKEMKPETDEILLVSGDGDYVPLVTELKKDGYEVIVAYWDHGATALKAAASGFLSLNRWFDHIVRYRDTPYGDSASGRSS